MKKILYLLLSCVLYSCNDHEMPADDNNSDRLFLKSYIITFIQGDWELTQSGSYGREFLAISFKDNENLKVYEAPEIGGTGESSQEFQKIAQKKGDTSYNCEDLFISYMNRYCAVEDLQSLQLKCLNKDFDDNHPKGSDISDVTHITLTSYAEYIKNGYTGEPYKIFSKRLSELKPEDLTLFKILAGGQGPTLKFEQQPAIGEYKMQLTITTTEGKKYSTECTYNVP